jgi:hypothetical protein
MKNAIRSLGFAAIAAIAFSFALTALSLTGCDSGDNGTTPPPAHVHQWEDWTVTTAATCTTAGSKTRTCALDPSHTETETVPVNTNAHNYRYVEGSGTAPTCTEDGNGNEECTYNPSHTRIGVVIPKLGHNYEWETTTHATCTTKGLRTGICTHDESHTTTEEIPINDDAHDWQAAPGGVTPTCTTPGSGTIVCSYNAEHTKTADVIPALGHDSGEWHTTLAATCTATGTRQLRCTRDDAVLNTETIAALGHNYANWTPTTAPTCTTAGVETGTCTHDATHKETRPIAIDPNAHDYEWKVTTAASYISAGIETEVCSHDPAHTRNTRPGDPQLIYITASIADLGTWLSSQPANTATTAFKIKLNVSDIGIASYPGDLGYVLQNNDTKYVSLDLSGITYIPNTAFYNNSTGTGCATLVDITIPDGVTSIGDQAFYGCTSLVNITIPNSVTAIGYFGTFGNCASLTQIEIPASVSIIQDDLFGGTPLRKIIFTGTGQYSAIADGRIVLKNNTELVLTLNTSEGNIVVPEGIISINTNAFFQCVNITSIGLPTTLTTIGNQSFYGCTGLTEITFPKNVTTIGRNALGGCNNLTLVTSLATTPPALEADAMSGLFGWQTPAGVQIKVPDASVTAYKAADGWSAYADKISAIE